MKSEMKLLFTCIGRRVELIQAFRIAAERTGAHIVIYGTDISGLAPALLYCDKQLNICHINDPQYIPSLIQICRENQITAVIPTIDTDILYLAEKKHEFLDVGTIVLISSAEMIRICRDKRLTAGFFAKCGLLTPIPCDNVKDYFSGFPCFIKPLNGSSSINAYKVTSKLDLNEYANKIDDYIIQPYIEGVEYTVDIFCDLSGNPIYITPRKRISVRSGEVLITEIVQDESIISECMRLIKSFTPCGAITVQLIREKKTGDDYFIEINPRFGGGVPLSIKAGADSAEALIKILNHDKISYQFMAAQDGKIYSRFDQSICVNSNSSHLQVKAVIFDLDDTLYSEKEYVKSGLREVAKKFSSINFMFEKLWSAFEQGKKPLDYVLKSEGIFSENLKEECLHVYRNHRPKISLYKGVKELIYKLKRANIKVGIITDGRPEGQRAKITALGLETLIDQIIITDEIGGIAFRKPCDISFRIMQKSLNIPFESIAYIGDNPTKDFISPKILGMKSIYFANPDSVYASKSSSTLDIPQISCIEQLDDLLF